MNPKKCYPNQLRARRDVGNETRIACFPVRWRGTVSFGHFEESSESKRKDQFQLRDSGCFISIASQGLPGGSDSKDSACNDRDLGLIPELGRSPGRGHGNPLQYSCLENPTERGAWQATVHRVTELDTTGRLSIHSAQGCPQVNFCGSVRLTFLLLAPSEITLNVSFSHTSDSNYKYCQRRNRKLEQNSVWTSQRRRKEMAQMKDIMSLDGGGKGFTEEKILNWQHLTL